MGNAIETTVTCCPMMPYRFECNTNAVGSDWGVFADCTTSTSTLEVGLDVIGAVPTSKLVGSSRDASGNPILTHAIINGYGIQVRWQQTDEALLFGITTPSTLSSTTTLDSSPPTMTAKTASSSHPNSGTIAGIAVGAVAGILILLGIVILIVRSKRKRIPEVANRESPGHSIDYNTENGPPTVELSGLDSDPIIVFPKYELPIPAPTAVIPRQELPVQAQRDTVHTAQRHSPEDQGDSWGRAHRAYSNPRELEAMERPGELEVGLHIAELADTDRRGQNYHS
ncbi:hypothetical protein SAMD00023353_1101170 [Rosellinia necatrix]|uniref:Uncharacterized protein n=1 Tax=Rosellinia necatrix TaxID=77044 RepID=A0A1S8A6I1_ROSNE|nr:hypothetical protein SAMD00023353_1101170 [Rosellinia necatrix]